MYTEKNCDYNMIYNLKKKLVKDKEKLQKQEKKP